MEVCGLHGSGARETGLSPASRWFTAPKAQLELRPSHSESTKPKLEWQTAGAQRQRGAPSGPCGVPRIAPSGSVAWRTAVDAPRCHRHEGAGTYRPGCCRRALARRRSSSCCRTARPRTRRSCLRCPCSEHGRARTVQCPPCRGGRDRRGRRRHQSRAAGMPLERNSASRTRCCPAHGELIPCIQSCTQAPAWLQVQAHTAHMTAVASETA